MPSYTLQRAQITETLSRHRLSTLIYSFDRYIRLNILQLRPRIPRPDAFRSTLPNVRRRFRVEVPCSMYRIPHLLHPTIRHPLTPLTCGIEVAPSALVIVRSEYHGTETLRNAQRASSTGAR